MEQLDFDFYFFRELGSGERCPARTRVRRVVPPHSRAANARSKLGRRRSSLETAPAPSSGTRAGRSDRAHQRHGERFVFFENATTGRGNVIYRRYDGHYGLIAPE